jgi:hypothetical protein
MQPVDHLIREKGRQGDDSAAFRKSEPPLQNQAEEPSMVVRFFFKLRT